MAEGAETVATGGEDCQGDDAERDDDGFHTSKEERSDWKNGGLVRNLDDSEN